MKLSDKILVIAKWLESIDNELLVESEVNECCMEKLAESFIEAADTLRNAADQIKASEPETKTEITSETLDEMAAVAAAFAESDDELLRKQANVLDEILFTLAAPKDYIFNFKKAENDKLEVLKKKYKEPKEEIDKVNKVSESLDAIQKSPVCKEYRPLEFGLQTRTCPDHPGAQMARIADSQFQCSLDHKIYSYDTGYTLLNGAKVPGGHVSEQTPKYNEDGIQMFDHRDSRLGIYRE